MDKNPVVYIMSSGRNGTLYVGVTSNILQRVSQHKNGEYEGFSKKYGTKTLVWYENQFDMAGAIAFEKKLKKYSRRGKLALIEAMNPEWRDLYPDLLG